MTKDYIWAGWCQLKSQFRSFFQLSITIFSAMPSLALWHYKKGFSFLSGLLKNKKLHLHFLLKNNYNNEVQHQSHTWQSTP
jgi:hypothetical protein